MAGLLYHVPGAAWLVPEPAHLAASGLADVLGGAPVEALPCAGPDGPGVLLYSPADPPDLRGYRPERQVWRRRSCSLQPPASSPPSWVGYWKDSRPGPEDLVRSSPVPGHLVELGDGHRWCVPIGRNCRDGNSGLPGAYVLEAGALAVEVVDQYRDLWTDVQALWVRKPHTETQLVAIAYRALAVNYRLGSDEINLLELVGPHNAVAILGALLDFPTIAARSAALEAAQPKKADAGEASPGKAGSPAGSNIASGAPGPSPATPPASPTSAG